jgi:hypothetical protein
VGGAGRWHGRGERGALALVSDGDVSLSRGEVARQYSWSPYGQLLRADIYDTSAPMSRLGHQGLFHDRLDADILSEPMVAFARQAVQNRNRALLTWLGRFAQRDPNGSAVGALDTPSTLGSAMTAAGISLEVAAVFRDGQSLYAYVGCDAINGRDPLGLFFSFVGVQSATGLRSELAQQQFEVGIDVATALFAGILSGASLHSTMVEILSDTFGRDSRFVDDALMAFNEAVLDFRDARRLDTALRGHHIVAKFLGGDSGGMLVYLTDAEHNHIHRLIDKELDKRGLPKMREMSQSQWDEYLRRGNRADSALHALRAGTRRFDRLYGTNLIAELDRALAQQVRAGKRAGILAAAARAAKKRGRR